MRLNYWGREKMETMTTESTFKLELELGNAAFEDNPQEIQDILRRVIAALDQGIWDGSLRDSNGNTVGSFTKTR